ncbi:hypothetical protein JAAARDRAFT_35400 [Jaapia argillacea MUCL 33604]|uniref:Altered inheritance of mitochondria protein 41 n=1 Tax=Jaapia argillacea MUCL 33604 TaxID=933084 RepID=A0A067PSJ4_9AGAM|nr:hypothetical protein JAAARDRAFT_35400 [Jaapia argillacea MUCL 33604]
MNVLRASVLRPLRSAGPSNALRWSVLQQVRGLAVQPDSNIRAILDEEVKKAMKSKDTFTSTLLRSVIAEIQTQDKKGKTLPTRDIFSVIRGAYFRRVEAAEEFTKASRTELAGKETKEAEVLLQFFPPRLSAEQIDVLLKEAYDDLMVKHGRNSEVAFKNIYPRFYSTTDRAMVDGYLVRERLERLKKSVPVPRS